jgi:hypothetical protein
MGIWAMTHVWILFICIESSYDNINILQEVWKVLLRADVSKGLVERIKNIKTAWS